VRIAHGDDLDHPAGIAMQAFIDSETCDMPGGPGGLKIKAAGHPIDIENLTGKVEVWNRFTFHRFQVQVIEGHSAAGHKFLFIEAFSSDFEFCSG
jgi:hypothetical protein